MHRMSEASSHINAAFSGEVCEWNSANTPLSKFGQIYLSAKANRPKEDSAFSDKAREKTHSDCRTLKQKKEK